MAAEAVVGIPPQGPNTNAVNRRLEHLDVGRWFAMLSLSAGVRTVLQHPLNVAAARKRVLRDDTTVRKVLSDIRAISGIRGLFRGVGAAICGNILGEVCHLGMFEVMRQKFQFGSHAANDAAAGLTGDSFAVFFYAPFGMVCNRQMTAGLGLAEGVKQESLGGTVKTIIDKKGLLGMYTGVSASFLLVPASAVWWSLYGTIKHMMYAMSRPFLDNNASSSLVSLRDRVMSSEDNVVINAVAAATTSAFVTVMFNPVVVLRTRLQVYDGNAMLNKRGKIRYVIKDLLQKEGWKALFKGAAVNVGVAVTDGILFSQVYELTRLGADITK
jgi:hypothetical protein